MVEGLPFFSGGISRCLVSALVSARYLAEVVCDPFVVPAAGGGNYADVFHLGCTDNLNPIK